MVDDLDKKVIRLIQGDLPLDLRPFAILAEKIGIPEDRVISRIVALKEQGVIRRFGATLRHQEAGFRSNAMIAWMVPPQRIEQVGKTLSEFREVTHCYQRKPQRDWHYNLYSMIHAASRDQCHQLAERMSQSVGVDDYILLFSEKEFRKTSMAYF
jgi:DNA-binding Lrp family transcriptional regulator